MNNAVRYQVIPPLSSEEYQEVRIKSVPATHHDKKRLAAELLRADPFRSNGSVAMSIGLDSRTVKKVREEFGIPTMPQALGALIEDSQSASDRELARRTGLARGTVAKYRRRLQTC